MLTILFLLIWRTVATIHGYIKAYAPSNIAIAYLRSPRGLKWAIPAALLVVPAYLWLASAATAQIDGGASTWLLGVTLVCIVDACKFSALALLAPLLTVRTRLTRAPYADR